MSLYLIVIFNITELGHNIERVAWSVIAKKQFLPGNSETFKSFVGTTNWVPKCTYIISMFCMFAANLKTALF